MNDQRMIGLDALRGIAAFAVLGFHVDAKFGGFEAFARGYLAVDLFFMLSGFVLDMAYAGHMEFRRFIVARIKRVWPTMAVGAMLGFIVFAVQGVVLPLNLVATLLFLPLFTPIDVAFVLNRCAWSIFFELVANGAHALVFRRLSTIILVALTVACFAVVAALSAKTSLEVVGARSNSFFYGFARVGFSYLGGILLSRFSSDLRIPAVQGGLFIFPAVVIALALCSAPSVFDAAVVASINPLVIVILARSKDWSNAALSALGQISFPLYAVHYPILQGCIALGWNAYQAMAASLVFAACVAYFSARLAQRSDHRVPLEST
ncbi:acyltransferase [Novosphingobium sp. YJ-S2-02]|uniref:Acyltransferase n=2 Tax=Novosphingobium aureum TaxID=2792964 RepID=A0A931HD24_9SPHN|nr:acyltransferase [Novosphingobium aureum]